MKKMCGRRDCDSPKVQNTLHIAQPRKRRSLGARIAIKVGVVLAWLAVWQLIYLLVGKDILVASPWQVATSLYNLVGTGEFWLSAALSLLRIMAGFVAAIVAGTLLAVLTSFVPLAREFFAPLIGIIKATPVASFIILALIWMATGMVAAFIAFLMVLPVVWANASQGILKTDVKLLEMAQVFGFSRGKVIKHIYIPSVMPYFVAASTTGMGMAWKAGIAAEVLGIPAHSIGLHLYSSKIYLETADLFAWTAVVILLSVLLEKLMVRGIAAMGKRYNAQGA